MIQWTLVNNIHRWANSHNISCCCIIHQHNCPHPTTTTQKTEWSDPIITWDIASTGLRLPSLITIVHIGRPHHLIVILSLTFSVVVVLLLRLRGYGNISSSSYICSVHLTNQYTRQWSICPTHTHASNHNNTSPLLSPSHIHWTPLHKFLVTNKGLLLHN